MNILHLNKGKNPLMLLIGTEPGFNLLKTNKHPGTNGKIQLQMLMKLETKWNKSMIM